MAFFLKVISDQEKQKKLTDIFNWAVCCMVPDIFVIAVLRLYNRGMNMGFMMVENMQTTFSWDVSVLIAALKYKKILET